MLVTHGENCYGTFLASTGVNSSAAVSECSWGCDVATLGGPSGLVGEVRDDCIVVE